MPEPTRDETRDKRQAILTAARDLFATQGYEETTIAEIAHRAGVAVGTVYLYFENKHDVLVDVCLELNGEVAKVIQSPEILALPIRAVPRAVIEASFRPCHENARFMKLFQVNAESFAEGQRLRKTKQQITQALDGFFRYAIAQGLLAPFNTIAYAEMLNTLVGAVLHQCFAVEDGQREVFYRESLIEMVERLFFGPSIQTGQQEIPEEPKEGR